MPSFSLIASGLEPSPGDRESWVPGFPCPGGVQTYLPGESPDHQPAEKADGVHCPPFLMQLGHQ